MKRTPQAALAARVLKLRTDTKDIAHTPVTEVVDTPICGDMLTRIRGWERQEGQQ